MKNLFALLSLVILISCGAQKEVSKNFYEENKNVNLFAFIGKKISVTEFDPNAEKVDRIETDSITGEKIIRKSHIMDNGFRCKYLIIRNVFNELKKDTIDFTAYDHYGRPNFEKSEYVILYISKSENGKYYHQKYQFNSLEKDSNGEFTGTIYKVKKKRKYETHIPKKATIKDLFYDKKKKVFKNIFANLNGG